MTDRSLLKVLMVDLGYVWGGQEVYSSSLIEALRQNGHTIHSFSSQERFASLANRFFHASGRYLHFMHMARQLAAIQKDYDVVHFNGNRALYLSRVVPKKVPFVGTKHSPYSHAVSALKRWGGVHLSPFLFGHIDALITVCAAARVELPQSVRCRSFVVENGVRARLLPSVRRSDTFTIAYVARLVREKGIIDALRSVHWLKRRGHAVRFLVAGDGDMRAEVSRFVRENSLEAEVHLFGFTDKVDEIYSQAHVCVLPSSQEGMPLNLLEAFSARCPVVAYDIPGVDEVVQHGFNGFLVKPGWENVGDALLRLATEPELQTRLAEGAYTSYLERFTLSRMVDKTLCIYRAAAERRTRVVCAQQ